MDRRLDAILPRVTKPARYTNHEWNSVHKDWDAVAVRVALAFPDVYEVGMGNLGLKILYSLINEREDALAERVFAPMMDFAKEMKTHAIPLFAIESKRPLGDFDLLGFTLQTEMSYSNVLFMLDLSYIPRYSKDRGEEHPFVIAGGPCVFNGEPMAPFFDAMLLGEGEEAIHEILEVLLAAKKEHLSRGEVLHRLSLIAGVYVPSFYEPDYDNQGEFLGVRPVLEGVSPCIQKRIVRDFDAVSFPGKFVVPFLDVVHDRVMVEIMRGCTRGCRFCQAGIIYRPVREKNISTLQAQIDALLASTGYDEVSLTSLSSGDYGCIAELITRLAPIYGEKGVALSLPSLRLDSFSIQVADEIQKVRKTGLTFAPEAGTQRLRDVINKNVTEEDLLKVAEEAFSSGWHSLKLYFMIGLPTETLEDIEGIALLAKKALSLGRKHYKKGAKRPSVTVSVSSFVPKAWTSFQWEGQNTKEELREKQQYLRDRLHDKGLTFQYHHVDLSLLEGALARGDRRLAPVIARAVDGGCTFDGWDEHFQFEVWKEAFSEEGFDLTTWAQRKIPLDKALPWDHLDTRVSKAYLLEEYGKAHQGMLSSDCRLGSCSACGVCGKEGIKTQLSRRDQDA